MKGGCRALWIQIWTCIASAALFGLSAIIVKFDFRAATVPGRLFLWLFAVALELVSFFMTQDIPGKLLINNDYIAVIGNRVRTLTTIILGEGA